MTTEGFGAADAPDIVYLGAENLLKGVFSRSQAIARQLSRWSRVLYVNTDYWSAAHYAVQRLLRRKGTRPLGLQPVCDNLWALDVVAPVSAAIADKFNRLNLSAAARQLRGALRQLNFGRYVLWFGSPMMASLAQHFPAAPVCYDYMDEFPDFFEGRERARVAERERRLLRSCDAVIATSRPLYEKARRFNNNVHLVRNGVAVDHYAGGESSPPQDLRDLPRPILGYIGSVGSWFDAGLFKALSARYPQGSLVIAGGRVQASAPELSGLPNAHVLGWKPHREIPRYLRAFDVCLIPFLINELTLAVNPIKFYEHCAAGKPTVSVGLPELEPYRDLCYLAGSREEFLQGVELALREPAQPERLAALAARRRKLAEENSWDARGRQLRAALTALASDATPRRPSPAEVPAQ